MSGRVSMGVIVIVFAAAVVATAGVGLVFVPLGLAIVSRRVRDSMVASEPGTLRLGATAGLFALAAYLFFRALVFDSDDNAYLFVLLMGVSVVPVAFLFGVAALLPSGRWRLRAAIGAVGLSWGILITGGLGTTASILVIPGQNYSNNDVLLSHVLALGLVVGLIAWLLVAFSTLRNGVDGAVTGSHTP